MPGQHSYLLSHGMNRIQVKSSRSLLYHVFPTSCISSTASTTTLVLDYPDVETNW